MQVRALEEPLDFRRKFVKMIWRWFNGDATMIRVRLGEYGALGALQSEIRFRGHSVMIWGQLPALPFGHTPIDV